VDILEREIEKKFGEEMQKLGCLVCKFTSPGKAGVPDRLVILPGGSVWFAEMKRPGGKLRPRQVFWKKQMESLGAKYYVVDSYEAIANVVNDARLEIGGDAE
jgi:hypothetical protein